MTPSLIVAVLLFAFAGSHIGLATARVRESLRARLGPWGFSLVFSAVAAVTFTVLVRYYATHRFDGAPGLGLGTVPAARLLLMGVVGVGVVLFAMALASYPRSPMALFNDDVPPPYGVARITRHAMFVGVVLFGTAHALLASHLVGTTLFAGLALFGAAGAYHQDRKLLALRGPRYRSYLTATSVVPFAAILDGRQQLVWREFSPGAVGSGLAAAIGLRLVHGAIFAHDGLWVIVAMLGGAAMETLQAWRRAHRHARRAGLATHSA